jgi:hypothetical protein
MAADGVARFDGRLVYERGCRPNSARSVSIRGSLLREVPRLRRDAEDARVVEAQCQNVASRAMKLKTARSELGRQVTVDLQADADFDESRGGPGHDLFPHYANGRQTAVARAYGNTI